MKQILIRKGEAVVEEVPAPQVGPRHLLVRTARSCVSVGTESAGVRLSAMPLYRRALKHPEQVALAFRMLREEGLARTVNAVRGVLAAGDAVGYSSAGIVIAAGPEVEGFAPGDRVACAGAGVASHAEVANVPVNLAVKVPNGLDFDAACTVTLGAIALQGVRRCAPTLGETVAVIGLGLLGQLTVQLLKAAGCRVVGADLDPDRVALARTHGMDAAAPTDPEGFIAEVLRRSDGFGADAVLIAAAAASDEIVSQAFRACRKKGRVVLVGDVGLHLRRPDFYAKEIDFLISTSYGPGRYDPLYEEGGRDYPIAYVRWTENRNMAEYLRLLAEGKISLEGLLGRVYPVDRAAEAYAGLKDEATKPLAVVLAYPERENVLARTVPLRTHAGKGDRVGVAVAGAGAFAQGAHLPNLMKLHKDFALVSVMSRTGANAKATATRFGAARACTDFAEVLADPAVDLVMVCTRHHLHADMALAALAAGKHVFVEKPLCLTREELERIAAFYAANPDGPVLMTGFNRRFSPPVRRLQEALAGRSTPLMASYRMNAGYLPPDHWTHGPEGGGRNLGEAVHIYDLFLALTGSRPVEVMAAAAMPAAPQWRRNDNFTALVTFADGSVCSLAYTALGHGSFPKEQMEVFADGKVASLDNYVSLQVYGAKAPAWTSRTPDKGLKEELEALAACLVRGGPWPIPLQEQLDSARIALKVEQVVGQSAPSSCPNQFR